MAGGITGLAGYSANTPLDVTGSSGALGGASSALGLLGASNPWIAGASMIMGALSGTEINTSSAQAMTTSGLGAFGAENTNKISAAAIDLTDPLTLGIACTVVVLGAYILKKRFR